jgi:integrase
LIESCPESQKVRSTRLIVTEDGTPMTVAMLRRRFDLTREAAGVQKSEFQMRDLRAKAGTDKAESIGDILQARDQLGHTTVVMTEQYIRHRLGKKVTPTK